MDRPKSSAFSTAIDSSKPIPDPTLTPGDLCTDDNSDFDEYRYKEQVAHCARHFTDADKRAVGKPYGVEPSQFSRYEFDHLIPLGVGGSNSHRNVWPMIKEEARRKAKLDQELYLAMSRGEITQREAIRRMRAYFETYLSNAVQ